MSEKTKEELKMEEPGMHFYSDTYTARDFASERFSSLCAQRTHAALRKNTKITGLRCPWMLSVSGSYGVDVIVNPVDGFETTKTEEHKIMRWLKQSLGLPKTAVFKRQFYAYTGKFEWKLYDYNHFKAGPGNPFGDQPLTLAIANRSHNCKLVKIESIRTEYKAVCKDDKGELESFG